MATSTGAIPAGPGRTVPAGTGKGLGGRAVHSLSSRKAGPFIQVNCGAIPHFAL